MGWIGNHEIEEENLKIGQHHPCTTNFGMRMNNVGFVATLGIVQVEAILNNYPYKLSFLQHVKKLQTLCNGNVCPQKKITQPTCPGQLAYFRCGLDFRTKRLGAFV